MIARSPYLGFNCSFALFAVVTLILLAACGGDRPVPNFDAARTFDLLIRQTDLGPRNPGSPGWHRFQEMLGSFLDSLGVEYETQPFDYYDYLTFDTLHLVNWIARLNPESSDRILIAAHYDCRPRADYDPDSTRRDEPIVGANDGASATAVLMHLAELLISHPPRIGVDLVFFDGEDYGPAGREDQYLLGSTHFASHHEARYRFGIVIDMIGDRDLQIYREFFSERYHKELNDKIWNMAAQLGVAGFIDSVKHDVLDDHIPLIAAGIPTVDIIDFEYPYWHTHADTPDKCDTASLSAVGRVIVGVIYAE
jgi:hypothetical protein